ncbi:MAG: hypothetical protein AAF937_02140 [Planctomycetota bacterium]
MPARRSRTERWKESLRDLASRRGPIEISIAAEQAKALNWRVRLLAIRNGRLLVEQPVTLGRRVPVAVGTSVVGSLSIGQNRWMFTTAVLASGEQSLAGRPHNVLELLMPEEVERCQRRSFYRISTASLDLPSVECAALSEPAEAVPLQVATRAAILDAAGVSGPSDREALRLAYPTSGITGEGELLNIGGGGACLRMAATHGGLLDRPSYFLLNVDLTPMVPLPLPITAKLAHTRIDSSQSIQAGFAFDFSQNQGYEPFVSEVICRYIAGLQGGVSAAA